MIFRRDKKPPKTDAVNASWRVRIQPAIYAAILLAVVFLSHAATLWNGFVLDDKFNVRPFGAVSIAKEKWEPVWYEIYTDAFQKPLSEPLQRLSLAIDYQSGHLNSPGVYHATNLLLAAFGVLLAFFLLNKLCDLLSAHGHKRISYALPLFACALFAAHPLGSESVAYISGRSPLICFVIYMGTCLLFLKGFTARTVGGAVFFSLTSYLGIVLCLFSSCQALTLPWTILILALMTRPKNSTWKDFFYERSYELGSMLLVALALPFVLLFSNQVPELYLSGVPVPDAFPYYCSQLKALVLYYLRVFFLPFGLSIHPNWLTSETSPDLLAALGGLLLAAACGGLYILRRRPLSLLGLTCFLFGLVPSLFPSGIAAHGARFYFSCFGLCLLLSDLVFHLCRHFKLDQVELAHRGYSRKAAIYMALPLLVLAGLSNWRDHAYAGNESLIGGSIRLNKDDSYMQALLSLHLTLTGGDKLERGMKEAEAAIRKNQELALGYLAMAYFNEAKRSYDSSLFHFERALLLTQKYRLGDRLAGFARGGIARSMAAMDMLSTANEVKKVHDFAKEGIKYEPTRARNYLALGRALFAEGKPESAELACRQYDKGRLFDLNDPDFARPVAEAALKTGYRERMEQAYGSAKLVNRLNNNAYTRLLYARAALESGRLHKGFAIMSDYCDNTPKPSAEALLLLSALEKQSNRKALSDWYLAGARALDKDIEKKVRLHLVVPPKPTRDKDNEGPERLSPTKARVKPDGALELPSTSPPAPSPTPSHR